MHYNSFRTLWIKVAVVYDFLCICGPGNASADVSGMCQDFFCSSFCFSWPLYTLYHTASRLICIRLPLCSKIDVIEDRKRAKS